MLTTRLQHTTSENVEPKEGIAQNKQFLLLPQCFQLFFITNLSFMESFHVYVYSFSKSSADNMFYVERQNEITLFSKLENSFRTIYSSTYISYGHFLLFYFLIKSDIITLSLIRHFCSRRL